jgi:hypothetical protein
MIMKVDLGSACNYAILAETGIPTPISDITGQYRVHHRLWSHDWFYLDIGLFVRVDFLAGHGQSLGAADYAAPTPG